MTAPRSRQLLVVVAVVGVCLVVVGLVWTRPWDPEREPGVRILISDDLQDTRELVERFVADTGIRVTLEHASAPDPARYAAVWLPTYGAKPMPEAIERHLGSGPTVMSSPVAVGLRPGVRARLAPDGSGMTWSGLARLAGSDGFTFGMVEPSAGDPGKSAALLPMATGLVGAPGAIVSQELYRASPQLRALRAAQTLRARDGRDLTTRFLLPENDGVDGIVSHESDLLRMKLDIVVPDGRTVLTRYRLRPVLTASASARRAVQRLTDYLRSPEAQGWIADHTHRRPGDTDTADGRFTPVGEVDTPRAVDLLDRLVDVYLDAYHYPTRVVFLLDVSGSMTGAGIDGLRRAFASLDATIATSRGADVEVLLIPFSTEPAAQATRIEVQARAPADGLAQVSAAVAALTPGGGTAIYAALIRADTEIAARSVSGREQVTSIILITDGANTEPTTLQDFQNHRTSTDRCTSRTREVCWTPVFPILVGAADEAQMRPIAEWTGGQVRDARDTDLGRVLRDLAAGR